MSAGPVYWGSYGIAVGWADVVNRHSNLAITVESKPGALAMREAVAIGDVNLGSQGMYSDVSFVYRGELEFADLPWTPAKNLRLIIGGLNTLNASYMTSARTGVKTFVDLKGKTIPNASRQSIQPVGYALLEAYGLNLEKDVKRVMVDMADTAWDELKMGRIHAVFDATNEALLKHQEDLGQLVWLPIDEATFEKAKAANPILLRGAYLFTVNPGDIAGLKMPGPVTSVGFITTAFTNTDLPDEAAYTIIMTLLEYVEEVQAIAAGTRGFSRATALPPVDVVSEVPYHPGAVKAFKELGLWTPEHEAMQQELLK